MRKHLTVNYLNYCHQYPNEGWIELCVAFKKSTTKSNDAEFEFPLIGC